MTASHLSSSEGHYKDAVLNQLAATVNVAQFVSFGPGPEPALRFFRVAGLEAQPALTIEDAIGSLMDSAGEGTVNVRSFDPAQPRGHEFIYGLHDVSEAAQAVRRLAADGLHTMVNETIDVHDGGVSGVVFGGVLEFAPDDTPRCVDKPGTASLPANVALRILQTVYGFEPKLDYPNELRVEFSVHPHRRGVQRDHTVVWEQEAFERTTLDAELAWPNLFSRLIGDKAFGLLVADAVGLPVPRSTVISRRVAPFSFGRSTATGEYWMRTAPVEQEPGRFTTTARWMDPFALLAGEDPEGGSVASILAQEGVDSIFSGAALASAEGLLIEGVAGTGEKFMLGEAAPERLPADVVDAVTRVHDHANSAVGPARFEWVYDGSQAWVVQFHRGETSTAGLMIYPGEAMVEHPFDVAGGLEALRDLVSRLEGTGDGVVLHGDVGVTSHFGDLLRRAKIPSRLEPLVS